MIENVNSLYILKDPEYFNYVCIEHTYIYMHRLRETDYNIHIF